MFTKKLFSHLGKSQEQKELEQKAADWIPSFYKELPVYILVTADDYPAKSKMIFDSKHEQSIHLRSQYKTLTLALQSWVRSHCDACHGNVNCESCGAKNWERFHDHLFNESWGNTPDVCMRLYSAAKHQLETILHILSKEDLAIRKKRMIMHDLSKEVQFCSHGVMRHIEFALSQFVTADKDIAGVAKQVSDTVFNFAQTYYQDFYGQRIKLESKFETLQQRAFRILPANQVHFNLGLLLAVDAAPPDSKDPVAETYRKIYGNSFKAYLASHMKLSSTLEFLFEKLFLPAFRKIKDASEYSDLSAKLDLLGLDPDFECDQIFNVEGDVFSLMEEKGKPTTSAVHAFCRSLMHRLIQSEYLHCELLTLKNEDTQFSLTLGIDPKEAEVLSRVKFHKTRQTMSLSDYMQMKHETGSEETIKNHKIKTAFLILDFLISRNKIDDYKKFLAHYVADLSKDFITQFVIHIMGNQTQHPLYISIITDILSNPEVNLKLVLEHALKHEQFDIIELILKIDHKKLSKLLLEHKPESEQNLLFYLAFDMNKAPYKKRKILTIATENNIKITMHDQFVLQAIQQSDLELLKCIFENNPEMTTKASLLHAIIFQLEECLGFHVQEEEMLRAHSIFDLILNRRAVDINMIESNELAFDCTPVAYAAAFNLFDIAVILLQDDRTDPNVVITHALDGFMQSETLLGFTIRKICETKDDNEHLNTLLKTLIQHKKINIESLAANTLGQTPLAIAKSHPRGKSWVADLEQLTRRLEIPTVMLPAGSVPSLLGQFSSRKPKYPSNPLVSSRPSKHLVHDEDHRAGPSFKKAKHGANGAL